MTKKGFITLLISILYTPIFYGFNDDYKSVDSRVNSQRTTRDVLNAPRILCDMDYIYPSACGKVSITIGTRLFQQTFSSPEIAESIPDSGLVTKALAKQIENNYWMPAKDYQYMPGTWKIPTEGQLAHLMRNQLIAKHSKQNYWVTYNGNLKYVTLDAVDASGNENPPDDFQAYLLRLVTSELSSDCADNRCPEFDDNTWFLFFHLGSSVRPGAGWGWIVTYSADGQTKRLEGGKSNGLKEAALPANAKNVHVKFFLGGRHHRNFDNFEVGRSNVGDWCLMIHPYLAHAVTVDEYVCDPNAKP